MVYYYQMLPIGGFRQLGGLLMRLAQAIAAALICTALIGGAAYFGSHAQAGEARLLEEPSWAPSWASPHNPSFDQIFDEILPAAQEKAVMYMANCSAFDDVCEGTFIQTLLSVGAPDADLLFNQDTLALHYLPLGLDVTFAGHSEYCPDEDTSKDTCLQTRAMRPKPYVAPNLLSISATYL